ncbi:MAG: ABC transporter ATP-binding protein [Oscillospiraceae bacterium]|nr:ABC transporter ATP-binding protein [Oscillospiraceae bacterium]
MLKLLRRLSPREFLMAAISTALIVLQVFLDLRLPDYMTEITMLVQTSGSAMSDIWVAGGKMLACALGSLASSVFVGYLAAKIAAGFSKRLRLSVFDKVQSFSLGEINLFSTPSLITRSTNDITQVQMIIAIGLQVMIKAPILAVWAIIKIAGKGWQWTSATAVAVGVLLIMVTVIITLALPRFRRIQTLTDNLNRISRENLTGLRVVRAYNAEAYQQNKFKIANNELTNNNLFTTRIMAIIMPCMNIIMNGLTLSVYWIGASLIDAAEMMDKITLFSNMVVFTSYAMQVVMAFMMLTMVFIMLPRATVSAKRILEVLNTDVKVKDGPGVFDGLESEAEPELQLEGDYTELPLNTEGDPELQLEDVGTELPLDTDAETELPPKIEGEVEFINVSFKYPNAEDYVIRNVNFKASKGETIAFIGSTGCGKSTLINLIPRFYDATEGEVLIDGIDVRQYTQKQLRNKLGYIPQRSVLFTGTVSENVAYGDNGKGEYSPEAIKNAVRIAQSEDFVEQMPEGYDAPISQGGTNVSGGQKQRLCIARAVCRDPEIFIFDDSFSALDYKTDRNLRTALSVELAGATCLIVAARIGTIRDADKIVVLEQGEVVGIGSHRELLKSCEVYREIALSQLSEEELTNE